MNGKARASAREEARKKAERAGQEAFKPAFAQSLALWLQPKGRLFVTRDYSSPRLVSMHPAGGNWEEVRSAVGDGSWCNYTKREFCEWHGEEEGELQWGRQEASGSECEAV